MNLNYFLLCFVLLTSCKAVKDSNIKKESHGNLDVYFYTSTIEDQYFRKYYLENEDPDFDLKSLFFIFNINDKDLFYLEEIEGVILLNNVTLEKRTNGAATPMRYHYKFDRRKSYLLKINNNHYILEQEDLKKYKYVYLEKENDRYQLIYTNYRRGYR